MGDVLLPEREACPDSRLGWVPTLGQGGGWAQPAPCSGLAGLQWSACLRLSSQPPEMRQFQKTLELSTKN